MHPPTRRASRFLRHISSSAAAVSVAAALCAPLRAQTPTAHFTSAGNFDLSESEPHQTAVDDFDHDGHLDLAVTTTGGAAGDGRLNILLGDGQGDFSDNLEFTAGHAPWALGKGDFNNDGDADLAVAESGGGFNKVHVFLGDGSGSFAESALLTASSFPIGIATGDFNQDGKIDLAVANNVGPYGIVVFLGNGNGTFSAGQNVPSANGFNATRIAAGDFDGDADLDLALAHYGGVRIYLGAGDGTFTGSGGAGSPAITEALAVADLDGDGILDIASVETYTSQVRICKGSGTGTFSTIHSYAAGSLPSGIAIADVTHDGVPDVLVSNMDGNGLSIFLGLGAGAFLTAQNQGVTSQPMAVAAGDWDEDGLVDLAAPCRNFGQSSYVSIFAQDIPAPTTYCVGKVNSQGCTPAIGFSGTASTSSASPFDVTCTQIINHKNGFLLYGYSAASTPFNGGTLCIGAPLKRTPAQSSNGNAGGPDCSGAFSYDMNARIQSGIDPALRPGILVDCQYWYRDPASSFAIGLSNALSFVIAP